MKCNLSFKQQKNDYFKVMDGHFFTTTATTTTILIC